MENAPEAAGAAQASQTEATPTNSNPAPSQAPAQAPAQAPDMYGFTSDQLADMRKFFEANGGFDKVKAKISNPTPRVEQNVLNTPAPNDTPQQPVQAQQPEPYRAPEGSITAQEFLAQQYFGSLANDPKYAAIADDVRSGSVLKDMAAFNIRPINNDGSINDTMVRRYLDLKAQTVVAKQTSAAPEASAAPTVDYVPYNENNMDMKQAMAILQQDSSLRSRGLSPHPNAAQAEEFMKKALNPQK